MITTTQTSKGLLSGKKSEDFLKLTTEAFRWLICKQQQIFRKYVLFVCFRGFCLFLFVSFVCFSLGVALSRGHGKFFFRGNVTVEEGRKSAFLLSDSFLSCCCFCCYFYFCFPTFLSLALSRSLFFF